jgi:serine protease AprX
MRRILILIAVLALALAATVARADARRAFRPAGSEPPAKVDPRVWADAALGKAQFLVLLNDQVDARAAALGAAPGADAVPAVAAALRARSAAGQPAVRTQLDALGARYRSYWIVNALAVTGDRAVVRALAARPDVKAIQPDRAFRVPLEEPDLVPAGGAAPAVPSAVEWNLAQIGAPQVWQAGFTGQGIVYANADTGVQWDHPALKPHYRGWDGAVADHNYNWWDAIHTDLAGGGPNTLCPFDSPAPCDDYGHGTHTMGIGVGDDGAGNQVGVAPGAKWIACRNMDRGVGRPSTYIECLQFLMAPTDLQGQNPDPSRHADVISNSYGCPTTELCTVDSLRAAVDAVRAAGIFMSVSAGNYGSLCSTVTDPPAIEASAIVVGNTDDMDVIAPSSSRGPVTVDGTGHLAPDLSAPGTNVRSSVPVNIDGAEYAFMTGTSMAAPHVAGSVALLWSAYPRLRGQVGATQTILQASAVRLYSTQGCGGDTATQAPNNVYGYGRVDVAAALSLFARIMPRSYFPIITG